MVEAKSHQSVDWAKYFQSIRAECPWGYRAYLQGQIDIVEYTGEIIPLAGYRARVYVLNTSQDSLEALCRALDQGDCEWLWSYPGYGPYATDVPVLIQQDRAELARIRLALNKDNKYTT